MKSIEVQGKTVDEAIFRGLDEMKLSIDEVDIEILEEGGKRFLGMGTKQCRIRLTERDRLKAEHVPAQQKKYEHNKKEQTAPIKQSLPSDARVTRQQLEGERIAERSGGREPEPPRPNLPRGPRPRRGRQSPQRERKQPSINWGQPVDGGEEAEFLNGLLSKMGLACQVDCFLDEQCLYMRISGENLGVLIGRRGETLNALQYLTSLIANRGEGPYRRVIVDTENYRRKREETLRRLARRKAEEVRQTGKPLSLEPMNPYERRVLHSTLQGNQHVMTHSEGEEPHRHVVISLK